MWTGRKRKGARAVEDKAFAFASARLSHPRFDYLCIGGFETLLAALILKRARPEAFVAAIFTPSEGDIVLPARLAPLSPDFTKAPFAGLPPDLPASVLTRLESSSSRVVESFITLDDMAESFYARLVADSAREVAYLDPFEARHALPALRKDGATWSLEGAYALRGSRLFQLDTLGRALLAALQEAGGVLLNPQGLELGGSEARFPEGGTLPYTNLLAVDLPTADRVAFRPAVGVKNPLLTGAALIGEGFHGFSLQRGETVFVGAEGEATSSLTARLLDLLPGLTGAQMNRSFYLPCALHEADAFISGCFDAKVEKVAGWLAAQGLAGFGARGARAAAGALGMPESGKSVGEEGINQWFAGQR